MSLFSQIINVFFPKNIEIPTEVGSSYFKKFDLDTNNCVDKIWVAMDYHQEYTQNTIHRIKSNLEFSLVDELFEVFWQQLLRHYQKFIEQGKDTDFFEALFDPKIRTLITIVPPDPNRKLTRGFVLPELLGNKLIKRLDAKSNGKKTFSLEIIFDKKPVRQQTGLGRLERLQNLDGKITIVSTLSENYFENYDVVFILDDITTTGSTLGECAKSIVNCNKRHIISNQNFENSNSNLKIYGLVLASNSD